MRATRGRRSCGRRQTTRRASGQADEGAQTQVRRRVGGGEQAGAGGWARAGRGTWRCGGGVREQQARPARGAGGEFGAGAARADGQGGRGRSGKRGRTRKRGRRAGPTASSARVRRETPAWKYRQRAETVGAGDAVGMPSHGKRADAVQKPRSERGRAASEPCCTGKCQIHLPFHKANLHLPACGTVRGAHFADFVTQLARFRDTATRGPPKRVSPPTGRAWRPRRLPVPRVGLRATPAHARAAGRGPAACRSPRADVPGRWHRQFPAAARRFAERVAAPPRARPAPAGAL